MNSKQWTAHNARPVPRRPSEEGYILVAVMFLLAILILSMAVAVPRIREDIQRDRDVETMERGKQYVRAIQLYFRKFHSYPPNVDALVKTNEIRFLRKRYTDPITGKDDWKPIMLGQNKTPQAMGFFGQPMIGSALAGTGPGGIQGATPIGSSPAGGSSVFGGSSPSGSIFGSNGIGSSTGAAGTAAGSTSGGSSGPGGTDSGSGPGASSNPTFGGGGIIGFRPGSERESILVYKKKNHYNEWEFLYSPLTDRPMVQGGNTGTIGTPASGLNGTTPVSGSTTSTPTTPTSPQP